jgi:hypothetical protein
MFQGKRGARYGALPAGVFGMSISSISSSDIGYPRLRWALGRNGVLPGIVLLLCTPLLVALEPPSKPFLDKNSFYLSSAGFKVHFANDPAGKQALHALPPHRIVIHNLGGGDVRYLYAEPTHCVCVFIGNKDAYTNYRDMLSQPLQPDNNVAPDYKTQAGALLTGDPVDITGQPPYAAEYFRNYY